MKVTGEPEDGSDGMVVVVGVKLDCRSRELLTWALVKVAQSGDRVIALHVLDPNSEGKSTLLSLVKTFDSVLAAYEGFCNLKQVELKLKVCRGSSVRKVLVSEARSCEAESLIVGTSGAHRTVGSSCSVAKYCARKLPRNISVFAVDNGKVLFSREASATTHNDLQVCDENRSKDSKGSSNHVISDVAASKSKRRRKDLPSNYLHLATDGASLERSCTKVSSLGNGGNNNSMALVPVKGRESSSSMSGWTLLRQLFLHSQKTSLNFSLKNTSVVQWLRNLPRRQCGVSVYPDKKQGASNKETYPFSNPNVEKSGMASLSISKELEGIQGKVSLMCRLFTYQELLLATSNFMPENLVGKGGSSQVYRGCLPDGKELAVKILKPSEDVVKQFVSEINIVTTLHHKNIISLLGFCFEDNNLLLVYDFVSRGSLEDNLHGDKRSGTVFGWEDRYKVALGVAEALDYLHNGVVEPIIHRDVKSSNILLSDNFEAKLSDFGLAMWTSSSSYHLDSADVAGTFGYLAPEYFMHGKMNEKVDVYAFGVVLLELLSGRKPIDDESPQGQESVVMWAEKILKGGKVSLLVDPSLGCNYDHDQIDNMVLAATLCIRHEPKCRPEISHVLKLLQGDAEVTKWAAQQVSSSEELDNADDEQSPSNIRSFLNLALLNMDYDAFSIGSPEHIISIENYLQGRWSRTSSFH